MSGASTTAVMNEVRPRDSRYLVLIYPLLMLGVFFLIPFGIMVAVSFFHRIETAFYEPAFEFANYARFFTPLFVKPLVMSLLVAICVAAICVTVGFPFTYFLTRLKHHWQVIWLVFLLSVLSLSEVIIAFSWSVLLSRTAGLSNILVWLGVLETAESWSPGLAAMLCGLSYLALPYTILLLYPTVSRLDPELTEAARTLGASQMRTFFTVVVPVLRHAIVGGLTMVFVFILGAYLVPQILGQPQHWTLPVLITDQAIFQSNLPFAAALAVFLLAASLVLITLTAWAEKRQRRSP
jgi:putative spermidine/putrescine transport system permease protein